MKTAAWISPLFFLAAAYDGVLGILFLVSPGWVFHRFDITPPNHMGYVQFPAALLLIFALIFYQVARAPERNRGLILYGVLLKVSYCSIAFSYWWATDIPVIWKPFAVVDCAMAILFILAYAALVDSSARREAHGQTGSTT